jgi:hypothetical protein
MTIIRGIMAIIGAIVAVIVGCKWFLNTAQKRIDKAAEKGVWYDERQITAHGKAFEFATTVAAMYFLAAYACFKVWQFQGCEPKIESSVLMMGGVWIVLVSYHICCLMTDSALPLGNYAFPVVGYIAVGVLGILFGLISGAFYGLPLTGKGSDTWERLIIGFAFLSIGIIHLFARLRSKRDSE